jgi:hypothetical protein
MKPLTRRAAFGLAGVLWLAGIGSAAALTYELKRPLALSPQVDVVRVPSAESAAPPLDERVSQAPTGVLQLPPITIVGQAVPVHRPMAPPMAQPAALPQRVPIDISQMRCKEWSELEMGSGRVQVCE